MLVDAMQARDSSAQSNALRRVCELIETDSGDEHRVSLYSQLKLAKNMVILVEMLNSGDGELRGLTFKLLWFATRYDPFRTLLCKDLFVGPLCRALKKGEFRLAPRFASLRTQSMHLLQLRRRPSAAQPLESAAIWRVRRKTGLF
jgi:hypothetical protein